MNVNDLFDLWCVNSYSYSSIYNCPYLGKESAYHSVQQSCECDEALLAEYKQEKGELEADIELLEPSLKKEGLLVQI